MSKFGIEVYIEVFQKVLFYVINLTLRAKQNAPSEFPEGLSLLA